MNQRILNQKKAQVYKAEMAGRSYRHFKGGVYGVMDVAVHSETAELMVIYRSGDKPWLVWARPLDMFLSEVDHEKYPDVTQKMRFEPLAELKEQI